MKKIKITTALSLLSIMLIGCQPTSPKASVQTPSSTSNFKLYPYKSAILKYKKKDRVLIWDDWGVKTYESRNKDRDIIMVNNGVEYRIDHDRKKVTKMRNLIMDWLIVANKDLRAYYVDSNAKNALVKTGERKRVAGQSCNIWLNSVPRPSSRYCLYNDLIVLKKEIYNSSHKQWRVEEEATMAKFNTSVDAKLFTKIPNYQTRDMTKYSTEEIHNLLKNDPSEYKKSLKVANEIKTRGERHKKKIRVHKIQDRKMLEYYLHGNYAR